MSASPPSIDPVTGTTPIEACVPKASPDAAASRPVAPLASERMAWLDAARGIAIVLVVYGHALRGWVASGLIDDSAAVRQQDSLIYAFHVPTFFILSGLVAGHGLARGRMGFLRNRLTTIVYPYFLWSVLQGVLTMAAGGNANHAVHPTFFLTILWDPLGQFWFLYALFLCQLALLVPGRWSLALLVAATIAFEPAARAFPILHIAFGDLPLVAFGFWISAPRLDAWLRSPARAALIAVAAWGAFALVFWTRHGDGALLEHLALGATGGLATIATARLVERVRILRALGTASMAIYVAHVIATALLRTVARKLGVPPLVSLALGTLVGLAAPYVFLRLTQQWGIDAWFGFRAPHQRQRSSLENVAPIASR